MLTLKIGALAKQVGTSSPTIRYYESIGLLPAATRQAGGQRTYDADDVRRLTFIRRCRDFGFSIDQVRLLADLSEDRGRSCSEVRDIANEHLQAIRSKLAELQALERTIASFAQSCTSACAGGPGPECVPLVNLGEVNAAWRADAVAQ